MTWKRLNYTFKDQPKEFILLKNLEEVTKKGIFTPNSRCELKLQKSHLRKLDPYMDENAILQVGSCLMPKLMMTQSALESC